jgi:hypothetical protein
MGDEPSATDKYLARSDQRLDVVLNADLGELVEGHHLIARGLILESPRTPMSSELHYEFVPGLSAAEQDGFGWYWMVYASDDVGTRYADSNGGGFDTRGGIATHGTRDIGAIVPRDATQLRIRFEPPAEWHPPEPWCRQLDIALPAR